MIRKYKTKGIFKEEKPVIQYFGKDVENIDIKEEIKKDVMKYLYKDCLVKIKSIIEKGIIIGFEINQAYNDYYYIVYVPNEGTVYYMLANNSEFTKNIDYESD